MTHPNGFQVLIALDQLVNTFLGGMADETLSARAWRNHLKCRRTWPVKVINMLFFWQKNHCRTAYESEKQRKHLPEGYAYED